MPKVEEYHLHPSGWENDPNEERFKLLTLDYLSTITYTNSAVFFKLEASRRAKAVTLLKAGLERTFSQTRQLAGTIERDDDGSHSIVKRKEGTVKFVVQYLDSAKDKFPTFAQIAEGHFNSTVIGDIDLISNDPMTCGNKPEAHPNNSPAMSSVKANFIPGGLILNLHLHHWANGLVGFASFVKQLAENCYAIANNTDFPSFDPQCLDRGSFLRSLDLDKPSDSQFDAPPRPERNSEHKPSQFLTFHLRKSRAAALKKAATPSDGSRISTYNAVCALMWRVLCRIREPLHKPGLSYSPLWAEGVSIAKLFTDPPVPERMQGNLQFDITSNMSAIPQLNLKEIISDAPLSRLASYTREMTESVTVDMLRAVLQKFAAVRNKEDLSINLEGFPPMALLVSDWRAADFCPLDFGFGKPYAFRHFFGGVPLCQAIVYPPRIGPTGEDEGMEVQFSFETELVPQLVQDPDWNKYFEFRGVDASDEESLADPKAKL